MQNKKVEVTEKELFRKEFYEKLARSQADFENGRYMTLEEFKKFIDGLGAKYGHNNIERNKA